MRTEGPARERPAGTPDRKKFTLLASGAAAIVVLVLMGNAFLDEYLSARGELGKRKSHYENVLRKKVLSCMTACIGKGRTDAGTGRARNDF